MFPVDGDWHRAAGVSRADCIVLPAASTQEPERHYPFSLLPGPISLPLCVCVCVCVCVGVCVCGRVCV